MRIALAALLASTGVNALSSQTADAATLVFRDSIMVEDGIPSGVAKDQTDDSLWVAVGDGVIHLDAAGTLIAKYSTPRTHFIHGITPFGDLFLLGGQHGLSLLSPTDGAIVPFLPSTDFGRIAGVHFDAFSQTIVVTDQFRSEVKTYSMSGELISVRRTHEYSFLFDDPEGIVIDPDNGHMLVLDDLGGTSSLYELAQDGTLIDRIDLVVLSSLQTPERRPYFDPEGLAIDPTTGTLYVAFANEQSILRFDYTGTPGTRSDISALSTPLPGAAFLMASVFGAAGVRKLLRRKR